ncbi:hypothetical protein MEN41_22015 [Dolichospermum sp. ST_con]|nr:hypothetical protein [Dolichospermum sp. ST_con]
MIGNVKSSTGNFPFIYKARGIKSSLKEFLVTFIHWELVNKPKEAKVSFALKNIDYEVALAVALELQLLYHQEDPQGSLESGPSASYAFLNLNKIGNSLWLLISHENL